MRRDARNWGSFSFGRDPEIDDDPSPAQIRDNEQRPWRKKDVIVLVAETTKRLWSSMLDRCKPEETSETLFVSAPKERENQGAREKGEEGAGRERQRIVASRDIGASSAAKGEPGMTMMFSRGNVAAETNDAIRTLALEDISA